MRRCINYIVVVLVLSFPTILAAEDLQYRAESLPSLGGGYARARAVNNAGQIAGYALAPVQGTIEHAVIWNDGQIFDLGTLGGTSSRAMDINGTGYTVGWAANLTGATKPAYWDDFGAIHELPTLGGRSGTAWAINDSGFAVGNAFLNDGVYHATLWSTSGVVDLGTLGGSYSVAYDINNNGVVVGGADNAEGKQRACLWVEGIRVDLGNISGGSWDTARGINDKGQVILWGRPAGAVDNRAVLWNGGDADPVIDLGTFGGGESWSYGINNLGNVVGWAEDSPGYYRAFIYDGTEMTDLGTLGGMFSSAYGVSDNGVIAGYAQNTSGQWESVRWVPVPEPSSATILIGPLAFLTVSWRRRAIRPNQW